MLLSYLAAVLLPFAGLLAGVLVATRPGSWAKRQGVLIVVLSAALATFGIGLAPMLGDSYYAGKERTELSTLAREQKRDEAESRRAEEELAATEARLRANGFGRLIPPRRSRALRP